MRTREKAIRLVEWMVTVALMMAWPLPGQGAEKYPVRPINMIIGYAPGGASDLGGRIVAEKMTEFLGEPLTPVYKPGGGGALAASFVAKAKPDGYTLLVLVSYLLLPPEVKKLDYKLDDFALTGTWARAPYYINVKADSKYKTLKDLVEDAKKNPGKLSFGTTGTTVGGYFVYSLLAKYSGIKMTFVPFKSCGEVLTALMGGHIDAYFCVGVGGASESPMVRTLAVAEEKRLEGIADIPTISEFGWPAKFSTLLTYAFPRATPKEFVEKVSAAQKQALDKYSKEIGNSLRKVDMWPIAMDREATTREFRNQTEVIRMIGQETGLKAQ